MRNDPLAKKLVLPARPFQVSYVLLDLCLRSHLWRRQQSSHYRLGDLVVQRCLGEEGGQIAQILHQR
jgi:hypothetical protein